MSNRAQTIRISEPQFKPEVFWSVLSHLRAKLDQERVADERVLHHLLYFVDFDYYEKYEEQLTGATYRKDASGPTAVELKGAAADGPSGTAPLDASAVGVIDAVLAKYADLPALMLAEQARRDVPWLTGKACQTISYESAFYRMANFSVRIYPDFFTVIDQLPSVASVENWEVIYDPHLDALYWVSPSFSKGRMMKVSHEVHLYLSPTGKIMGVLVENMQRDFAERHTEYKDLTKALVQSPNDAYCVLKSRSQEMGALFNRMAETLKTDIYSDAAEGQLTAEDLNFMLSETSRRWPGYVFVPRLAEGLSTGPDTDNA